MLKAMVLGACTLIGSMGAVASEVNVDLVAGGWSHHNDPKNYNETHDSIGLKLNGYLVMRYRNSIRRESVVLGKYFTHWQPSQHIRVGGIVAAVSGYNSTGAVPAYLPSVSLDYGKLGTDIIVIPGMVTYAQFRIKDVHSFSSIYPRTSPRNRRSAISYSYGSIGSELSYWRRVNSSFDWRVSASTGFFGRADTLYDQGIRYDEWLDTDTFGIYGGYYPFKGRLAVEGGLIHNGIDYNATYRRWLGGSVLGPVEASAHYTFDKASYYSGLRYGSPWGSDLRWYAAIGAIHLTGKRLEIEGDAGVGNDTLGVTELDWYPVLQIGLSHTF